MSKLMELVDEIKQKISDNEYKLLVEEVAYEQKQKMKLSKVQIAIPWIIRTFLDPDGEDPCENSITIKHEFITLIIPTNYLSHHNIDVSDIYPIDELFNNSLNYDTKSFINNIQLININSNSIHIHNKTCIITNITEITPGHTNNE